MLRLKDLMRPEPADAKAPGEPDEIKYRRHRRRAMDVEESPDEALKLIPRDYEYTQYSSIVGTKLDIHKNIPHYSDLIMAELKNENQSRKNVINVFQKK